jgi:hypothetical protein
MTSPQEHSQEVNKYMDDLIQVTRDGTFQWKSANPTTFIWEQIDTAGNGARIILQKIDQALAQPARVIRPGVVNPPPTPPTIRSVFNLQGFEMKPGNQAFNRVALSGATDAALNQKLQELFDTITAGIAQQGLDFLKNFIRKPNA